MRRALLAAICAASLAPLPHASALDLAFRMTGRVTVFSNMAACGEVEFPHPVTAVGEFSSAGLVVGPGTIVKPVEGFQPVVIVNGQTWRHCLPDAYAGATAGYAVYTLTVSSGANDYVSVTQCSVSGGSLSCV